MKKVTKLLSMLLLVALCMSLFGGVNAFADGEVYVTQQDAPTTGTVTFTISPAAEVAGVVWNYTRGGSSDSWNAAGYWTQSADKSTLTITGTDWSCDSATTVFSFVNGSATADVVWGAGNSDYGRVGGTVTPTVTPTPTTAPVVAFSVIQKDAPTSTAYSYDSSAAATNFRYQISGSYALSSVTVDGVEIRPYCSYDSTYGTLSIPSTAIALGANQATHYIVFTDANGSSVSGFTIVDTNKYTSDDTTNEGVTQTPTVYYLIGSDTTVSFLTTADPSDVKIYDSINNSYISCNKGTDYTYSTTIYGTGITFSNDFLDGSDLKIGRTYQILCVYGSGIGQGILVGYLSIGNNTSSIDDTLYYTNYNTASKTEFKWISGSNVPEMYSPLFTIDGGYLQVSSNGGKSWSNVGINDYMIKLSNGSRTAYAYLGESYLNSLSAGSIYYFRAFVPAGKLDTTEVHSNSVTLYTGPTLTAVDTNKHVINSTKNLQFKCSEKISTVYVGNIQLTDANYFSLSNDKKYVTLSPEFLNGRTAGQTYTLTVYTATGEKLSTTFQILTTAQAASSPKTGDVSMMGLWSALLILSAMSAVVIVPKLRKQYR